jgi:LytS/YehU family sensor histidine kinase
LLLWTLPGIASSSQAYFLYGLREPAFELGAAFAWQMPGWYYWGAASPLILALSRRARLERGGLWTAVPLHLGFNIVLGSGHVLLMAALGRWVGVSAFMEGTLLERIPTLLVKHAHFELLLYWCIIAVGAALNLQRKLRESALQKAQLETRLAQAQLEALRIQLQPHFLFNTLNAISVLVRKQDIQGSIRMVTGVSDLLRVALDSSPKQKISLKSELDFVDRYLSIEQTRLGDRLRVSMKVSPETLDAQVPNMLLQPLVENAIKHAIAVRATGGQLSITAVRSGDRLRVQIRDDGPGFCRPPNATTRQGIGLSNVRTRLEQLYGKDHALQLVSGPLGGAEVTIELPFEVDDP